MILARQGFDNCVVFRLPIVGVVLAVLIFCSLGYCECVAYASRSTGLGGRGCSFVLENLPANVTCHGAASTVCGSAGCTLNSCWLGYSSCSPGSRYDGCQYIAECVECSNACEAQQHACEADGNTWIPGTNGDCGTCSDCDEQCQCEENGMIWTGSECIEDTTICSEDRQKCQSVGGSFSGTVLTSGGDKCCSSVCDLCGNDASKNVFRLKRQQCCAQNQAPPDPESQCSIPVQSGCGMTTSQWTDPQSNDWECQDPNNSSQTMDRFTEMCSDDYDDENNNDDDNSSNSNDGSSSSQEGDGSSSSQEGDGSSSSQEGDDSSSSQEGDGYSSGEGDGDCPECPYLAEIVISLGSIEGTTANILLCLQIPHLCPALDGDIDFSEVVDTLHNINMSIDELKYIVDGIRAFDSLSLRALFKLDSSTLRVAKYDSLILRNDTMTWVKFDALGNVVDTSVHTLNDTTRKWLQRIADSIGVTSDSLAAHIDSIVKHLPDSVLDSIVKYQQYANDNFDSILYGSGKGFSLVDSLIDSAVKYFQASNHYDSVYNLMFADSIGEVIDYLSTMPGDNAREMGYALGYGDTASSTLRGDLNGIREAIDGLGDTSGLGDALGGGGNGSGGADTSGYGSYVSTMSGRYSDLVKNAAGGAWGDSATLETVFASDVSDTIDVDSASERDNGFLLDSAQAMLNRGRDSLLRDTSLLAAYYDTLKTEMQFFNFDSLLIQPLREALPAVTSCPEDCFKGDLASGTMPHVNTQISVNYNLCRKWPAFGDADVFMIFRVLLRIITAITCIYIGAWYIANRKI